MSSPIPTPAPAARARRRRRLSFNPQAWHEPLSRGVLLLAALVAVVVTFAMLLVLFLESLRFFALSPPFDFFFSSEWSPRFAEAGDDAVQGRFGILPLLWGTLYISLIALATALAFGLATAIYLSAYAGKRRRAFIKPALEILAGIPTVVYGFFALILVGPLLRDTGAAIGVAVDATSALAAGLVMGVMMIPLVSSLSEDALHALPRTLREGSLALGATMSETVCGVLLPAALPGLIGAVILALSRAVGETMIVVMAAGIAARISLNPLESLTTITVKIVSQLTGDYTFDSAQTLVAFALGLTLFVLTLGMNMVALTVVRRHRARYG